MENKFKNLSLEMAVLGKLLEDSDNFYRAELFPEIFSDLFLRDVFSKARKLFEAKGLVGFLEVFEIYKGDDGAQQAIKNIIAHSVEIESFKANAELLHALYEKRSFTEYFKQKIENLLFEDNLAEIFDEFENKVYKTKNGYNFRSHHQVCIDVAKTLKEETNKPFSTGLKNLDDAMLGGVYRKKSYCFAARQKMGKTVALATISHNMAKAGVNHLFIAAEMGCNEIMQRNIAHEIKRYSSNFYNNKIQDFKGKVGEYSLTQKAAGYYVDSPQIPFRNLKNLVLTAKKRYNIEGVVLDYLQIVTGMEKGENEAQFQGRVAQWVAEICKKEDLFFVYAAQLNREGQLRGSDGIRNACDQLYTIGEASTHKSHRYMNLEASRYTQAMEVGSQTAPSFMFDKFSPFLLDYEEVVGGF
ncbi:MAG: DnaB-like helicase C-terminal domain-containing protein [Cetobacterium sp.]